MENRVITIARSYGSGGRKMGRLLAKELGYEYYDREILRIASDRIYRDKDGNQITDFISIKAHGRLAERCVEFAWRGCRLAAVGDFETVPTKEETEQPGFFIRARDVEFLSPRKHKAEKEGEGRV